MHNWTVDCRRGGYEIHEIGDNDYRKFEYGIRDHLNNIYNKQISSLNTNMLERLIK